jgi:hypothetical protein
MPGEVEAAMLIGLVSTKAGDLSSCGAGTQQNSQQGK